MSEALILSFSLFLLLLRLQHHTKHWERAWTTSVWFRQSLSWWIWRLILFILMFSISAFSVQMLCLIQDRSSFLHWPAGWAPHNSKGRLSHLPLSYARLLLKLGRIRSLLECYNQGLESVLCKTFRFNANFLACSPFSWLLWKTPALNGP